MSKSKFIHRETDVAATWGVSRAIIRECRGTLEEGTHWGKQGQHIAYSVEGLAQLEVLVGQSEQKEDPPEQGQEAEQASAPVEQSEPLRGVAGLPLLPKKQRPPLEGVLVVRKIFQINRSALQALDPDGNECTVRVRDNSLFNPGMEIPGQHLHGSIWKLKGRLPRWKGEKLVREG